jgi:hypothetical protein
MLVTRQSNFACKLCPNSDSRNGANRINNATAVMFWEFLGNFVVVGAGSAKGLRSDAAQVDGARTRAAAVFDDSFAAVFGRTAVVAVIAAGVVPVAGPRRRGWRSPKLRGIADDRGCLA